MTAGHRGEVRAGSTAHRYIIHLHTRSRLQRYAIHISLAAHLQGCAALGRCQYNHLLPHRFGGRCRIVERGTCHAPRLLQRVRNETDSHAIGAEYTYPVVIVCRHTVAQQLNLYIYRLNHLRHLRHWTVRITTLQTHGRRTVRQVTANKRVRQFATVLFYALLGGIGRDSLHHRQQTYTSAAETILQPTAQNHGYAVFLNLRIAVVHNAHRPRCRGLQGCIERRKM